MDSLKEKAKAIFEGRYDFPRNVGGEQNDEIRELEFWLDKIAQGIKTQRELLQHEAEVLIKRDWRLIQTSNDLKIERDKIRAVIENVDEGLILLNDRGEIKLSNSWVESRLDLKNGSLLGRNINNLQLNKKVITLLKKIKKSEKRILRLEVAGLKEEPEAEEFFLVSAITISKASPGAAAWALSFRDITREKKINQMKSEFISIAAHQLRTPLSAIKWIFHMLLTGSEGPVSQEQEKLLKKGYASNERMIVLVNDLLDVSRIEEGSFLFDFKKTNLPDLLKKTVEEALPLATENKIEIEFNHAQIPFPTIGADVAKLKLAFQNILENAVKYSNSGQKVVITLRKEMDSFLITFEDRGVGIPKDQHDRVFGKFFRGSNVMKTETDGTGLGLFITKSIIKKHAGEIWFESTPSQGTTFFVRLPINQGGEKL